MSCDPARPDVRLWPHPRSLLSAWLSAWLARGSGRVARGWGRVARGAARRGKAAGPVAGPAEAGVEICSEEELGRRGRLVARLSDPPVDVLVIRVGGAVFAVENRCPHLGSRLDDGDVHGRTITCTAHGRRFDLGSGRRKGGPNQRGRPLVTIQAWTADGKVWVAR